MDVLGIVISVTVVLIAALKAIFVLGRVRLGQYRIGFEIVYILSVGLSVMRVSQYGRLWFTGQMQEGFESSVVIEIGACFLNMCSLALYTIRGTMDNLTASVMERCEVCTGSLYAHGAPQIVNAHQVCGACAKAIAEAKRDE